MTKEEYAEFKKQFWSWFDALSLRRKEAFWYYGYDMAETNFYFSVYMKKVIRDERRQNH